MTPAKIDTKMNEPADGIEIHLGIPAALRMSAATLYDDAFGDKFTVAIPSRQQRLSLLAESLNLDFAFCATDAGQLVGLAGFKTGDGSFTDGMTYRSLIKHTGLVRGNWAAMVFSLYERSLTPGQLLMDGIVVDASMRGRGVGTRLLDELMAFAKSNDYADVRLDVIDTNPDARRMYERNKFTATKTENFGYLRWLLRFGASTTMIRSTRDD